VLDPEVRILLKIKQQKKKNKNKDKQTTIQNHFKGIYNELK